MSKSLSLHQSKETLRNLVDHHWGSDKRDGSMITHEKLIAELLNIIKPKSILEIGTLAGLSAAMFARYAPSVLTVDIKPNIERQKIWEELGVMGQIEEKIVQNNQQKQSWIKQQAFDLVFIDADHSYDGVAFDHECIKSCGVALFHDYKPKERKFRGLVRFLDNLKPQIFTFGMEHSRFALWLSEDSALRSNAVLMQWLKDKNQSRALDRVFNPFRPFLKRSV